MSFHLKINSLLLMAYLFGCNSIAQNETSTLDSIAERYITNETLPTLNLNLTWKNDSCFHKIKEYESFSQDGSRWHLHIGKENGPSLFIFGAVHSKDISSSQFDSIGYCWKRTKPNIVFFEGPNRGVRSSRESTIAELGESGFVRYLAYQENVESESLEPNPLAEYEHLKQYFSVDKVKLFYLLREAQRVRTAYLYGEDKITTHINELLQKVANIPGLNDTINSLTELKSAFNQYWGNTSIVWWKAPANWFDPLLRSDKTGGIFTNDINRLSSEYRNQHMYEILTNELQQGKKVMVVVGRNHVPMISEALKCWWESR